MHKSKHLAMLAACMLLTLFLQAQTPAVKDFSTVTCGNQRMEEYLPLLQNRRVAVLTNASGLVNGTSLVDTLLRLKIKVKKVFVPEHGFRGQADAGVAVASVKDKKTGLPVISLYGKNKKPAPAQLADVDVVLYDIQDLGVRFYTYISTMSYAMEACAENKKQMIVLDRPNPNGFYIDGPVLKPEFQSFLGLHPVPLVYGMTCGEYAMMVNGEGWLRNQAKCDLKVITMKDYLRDSSYRLPVKPSPNIPNEKAVLLYPSLGLFEGTVMSLGRGTDHPFQMVGHPDFPDDHFYFMPRPNAVNKAPRYAGKQCNGLDLRDHPYVRAHPRQVNLMWLTQCFMLMRNKPFFEQNFNYHAGNADLQQQLKDLRSEAEIRESWQEDLRRFGQTRAKYLLYPDFTGQQ
jgi:uncharacterized protein YbbC (DUF1343 family)